MSTRTYSRSLTAAVFALALALAGTTTAQADTLFGAGGVSVRAEEPSAGILGQAWTWMTEVWTGWFGVATEKEATETGTTTQSTTCTVENPCEPGDAGWGIDPNG